MHLRYHFPTFLFETDEALPTDTYSPIPCGDYDMLEIACMHRYRIRLRTSNSILTGIASDLKVANHEEFLLLRLDDGAETSVRIDRIYTITVLSEPRQFDEHRFQVAANTG